MTDQDIIFEDYANSPVPAEKTIGWAGLALVVIAIFVSLPAYIQGIQLGYDLGFYKSLAAFVAGSAILAVVGALCAYVGARTRLSTYMLTRYAFGIRGGVAVNLVFAITIFGWFGVVVAEFSKAVYSSLALLDLPRVENLTLYDAIGSALMVATAIFGFKGLNKLSNLLTPLLLLSVGAIIYLAIDMAGFAAIAAPRPQQIDFGVAVSSVVGAMIVAMVIFPDYSRYARSPRQAIIGVIVSNALFPVFFTAAAMSALASGESELVKVIVAMGLGLAGLFMIVFAAWTTNAANLYVTTLSLSTVVKGQPSWKLTIVCGLLGFLVAVAGLSNHLIPFLLVLGVALPPVGAIYVVDYLVLSKLSYEEKDLAQFASIRWPAFVTWGLASIFGFTSAQGIVSLTNIPTIDSILVAATAYYILGRFGRPASAAT